MNLILSAAAAGLCVIAATAAQAAEIRAFVTGAARGAYETLAPQFESASGHKLITTYDLPPALVRKIEAGEPYDVVIRSYDVEGLITQGKLVADSRTVLGRVGIGVAIQKGVPKPDFSTVGAFKRALIGAKGIATSGEGSSGRYILTLLDRLGIAEQVKPKIRSDGSAKLLARGEVDFAVTGLPPLVGAPDIEWLGYLPEEIQSWLVFSGGVSTSAKEPDAGRALLNYFKTPQALAVFMANGLEPP